MHRKPTSRGHNPRNHPAIPSIDTPQPVNASVILIFHLMTLKT